MSIRRQTGPNSKAFAALSYIVLSLHFAPSSAQTGEAQIHFRSPNGFAIIVPISINGSGPYDFLLDTGSNTTVIDPFLVGSLKLHETDGGRAITVAGSAPVKWTVAHSIEFGPIRTHPLAVIVRSSPALREVDPDIHGILGQDVLGQVDYLLDNRKGAIIIDLSGKIQDQLAGERIAMSSVSTPDEGDFAGSIVPVKIGSIRAQVFNLLLDSGSAFPVLSSEAGGIRRPTSHEKKSIRDDTGIETDAFAVRTSMSVGILSFQTEVRVTSATLGHWSIDGLLPTACFGSVYVSNTRKFVIFDPRQAPSGSGKRFWNSRHRLGGGSLTARDVE